MCRGTHPHPEAPPAVLWRVKPPGSVRDLPRNAESQNVGEVSGVGEHVIPCGAWNSHGRGLDGGRVWDLRSSGWERG